jgi:raffinose/stachyose/melibiose transport system substrate-binding protein
MKLQKRKKVLVAIAASLTLFLGACSSPSTSTSGEAAKNVALTWWWWGTGDVPKMNDWVAWVAKAYEDSHPGVTITVEERTDNDITTAFEAAAAAKKGPDIAPAWASSPVLSQVWAGNIAPLDNLISAEERGNWLNVAENNYEGQTWAAPIYIVGLPIAYNKSLFKKAGIDVTANPLETWNDFLGLCDSLNKVGITPIVGGNRSGFEGSWWFAHLGKQYMDSPSDLQKAVISGDFNRIGKWADRFNEMFDRKCFNKDVNSLELQEKYDVFNKADAAMVLAIDGAAIGASEVIGAENFGTMVLPAFGDGKMADYYTATQSISHFITSWSKNKKTSADFMKFWHSTESLNKWVELTGVMPADSRFDQSTVTDPIKQQLFALNAKASVWLSNFEPGQVFEQADLAGGQLISTRKGKGPDNTALWIKASKGWVSQKPEEVVNFKKWAGVQP